MIRERGDFYSMGENCSINTHAQIEGRATIRLGNNVWLAHCFLACHDGAVNMLNLAHGLHLDSVGSIDIRDNVYVGHAAIVMPGVRIGPNAIVGAGALVRTDVAEGDVVGGVPAKPIGRVADYLEPNAHAR
jgi:acetyltransferase-like isoleucine patch superfamily enzyme